MTAKEYLESKGYKDHDYMDSGMIEHISEMMEEYHKVKQCNIDSVSQENILLDQILEQVQKKEISIEKARDLICVLFNVSNSFDEEMKLAFVISM